MEADIDERDGLAAQHETQRDEGQRRRDVEALQPPETSPHRTKQPATTVIAVVSRPCSTPPFEPQRPAVASHEEDESRRRRGRSLDGTAVVDSCDQDDDVRVASVRFGHEASSVHRRVVAKVICSWSYSR